MPKISMLIPETELALIDSQSHGNRTAFMIAASVERARRLKREQTDREILASLETNAAADAAVYAEWEGTLADGLGDIE